MKIQCTVRWNRTLMNLHSENIRHYLFIIEFWIFFQTQKEKKYLMVSVMWILTMTDTILIQLLFSHRSISFFLFCSYHIIMTIMRITMHHRPKVHRIRTVAQIIINHSAYLDCHIWTSYASDACCVICIRFRTLPNAKSK